MKSWSRNYTTVISTTTMTFQLGTSTLIPVETITAFWGFGRVDFYEECLPVFVGLQLRHIGPEVLPVAMLDHHSDGACIRARRLVRGTYPPRTLNTHLSPFIEPSQARDSTPFINSLLGDRLRSQHPIHQAS